MNERNLIFKLLVLVFINISLMAVMAPNADAFGDSYRPPDAQFRADTNYRGRGGEDPAIFNAVYDPSEPVRTPDYALPLCECQGCRAGYRDFSARPVSHPFGGSRAHNGCDIAASIGTPVYASADGVVARAGNCGSFGNVIVIAHGRGRMTTEEFAYASSQGYCGQAVRNGPSSVYGHLSRVRVRQGQRVRQGDLIGYVGDTGRVTGAHLHYENRMNGRPVDPEGRHGIGQQITSTLLASSCDANFRNSGRSPGLMVMTKWLSEAYM